MAAGAVAAREGAGCDGGSSWNASRSAGGRIVAAGGPLFGVLNDPVAVGAVFQENGLEFLPESFNRENAETEADLGEDLADRAVAEQGRDFLGCGEGGEDGVFTVPRPRCGAGARFALGRRGAGGARRGWRLFGECGLERRRQAQGAGDAGEHQGDVFCAEANADPEDGHGAGALGPAQHLGQFLAVGDEFAEDAAQAGGAGGQVGGCLILVGIGELGWFSGVCRGGHGQQESTTLV